MIAQNQRDQFAVLLDACDGIPLAAAERRALLWLAARDIHIVEAIADVIRRARGQSNQRNPFTGIDMDRFLESLRGGWLDHSRGAINGDEESED